MKIKIDKITIFVMAILLFGKISAKGQVSINTDGSEADNSAMLDVKSSNKGFLPPRMTEAERDAISDPATGLQIYNTTTNCLDFYTGSKWVSICEGGVSVQNLPPAVSNVAFSGSLEVGQTLTGSYNYSDPENDPEGASEYKWYRADDATGTGMTEINGAVSLSYTLQSEDVGKYIAFSVKPAAQSGATPGSEVISAFQGVIDSYQNDCNGQISITYGGQTYDVVFIGGNCWMAENLNIGAMIQSTQQQADNGIIEKYCYNNVSDSCTVHGGLYNWDEAMQYHNASGSQGICPSGWHIPDDNEWKDLEAAADSQFPAGDPEWDNIGYRGYDVARNLKSGYGWFAQQNGDDLYDFTVLPSGECNYGAFHLITTTARFWTSDEVDTTYAWTRAFKYHEDRSYRNGNESTKTNSYLSIRCVKDQ